MRPRMFIGALALCLCAAAQTALNIDQLVSFVRSSIQLKHPDKQVAGFLSKLKLTEQLDDRTIEELQGYGAGSKTLEALRALREVSKGLPKPAPKAPKPAPNPIPPPSPEEQKRIIEQVREYALNYSKSLPDFICTQVTRRYFDPSGLEFWQSQDVITARLSYFEQKEDYKLVLVNNRAVIDQSYDSLSGATSRGEFGSLLKTLFEKKTHADFGWERWATLRGKRTHVFSYRVAQPYSEWHITYEHKLDIVPGYRGLVYVDRQTNMVLRVTLEAEDIPPSFPVQQASTVLDYDYTKIGERDYLLPLKGVVHMRHDKFLIKNEVEFRLYRKFSAETTVTFETPPPLPEDQTKEQPPK
jgi:hypothetical protein